MSILLRSVLCVGLLLTVVAALAILSGTTHDQPFAWTGGLGIALVALAVAASRCLPRSARREVIDDLAGYPVQLLRRNGFQ